MKVHIAMIAGFLLCLAEQAATGAEHRIGVWNLEKLSVQQLRGFPELQGSVSLLPRNTTQLNGIADHIEDDLKLDALVVTEIDADDDTGGTLARPRSQQLNQIQQRLGSNWEYLLGRAGGDLRIGFLYNMERIKLKAIVELVSPEFTVQGEDVLERDPLVVWMQLDDGGATDLADMIIVGLHLKSGQDHTHNHLAAVAKLVGDLKTPDVRESLGLPRRQSDEDDIVILGDLNDASHTNSGFKYLFTYLDSQNFEHLGGSLSPYPATRINGSQIDHIFVSADVERDLNPTAFEVRSAADLSMTTADYRRDFSDHYPLTFTVQSLADDD